MNYKLAKQLKDAGFPQRDKEEGKEKICTYQGNDDHICSDDFCLKDNITIPTLEELIDACGDDFESLIKICEEVVKDDEKWVAYSRVDDKGEGGETKKDAVAKLWLKLQ